MIVSWTLLYNNHLHCNSIINRQRVFTVFRIMCIGYRQKQHFIQRTWASMNFSSSESWNSALKMPRDNCKDYKCFLSCLLVAFKQQGVISGNWGRRSFRPYFPGFLFSKWYWIIVSIDPKTPFTMQFKKKIKSILAGTWKHKYYTYKTNIIHINGVIYFNK